MNVNKGTVISIEIIKKVNFLILHKNLFVHLMLFNICDYTKCVILKQII